MAIEQTRQRASAEYKRNPHNAEVSAGLTIGGYPRARILRRSGLHRRRQTRLANTSSSAVCCLRVLCSLGYLGRCSLGCPSLCSFAQSEGLPLCRIHKSVPPLAVSVLKSTHAFFSWLSQSETPFTEGLALCGIHTSLHLFFFLAVSVVHPLAVSVSESDQAGQGSGGAVSICTRAGPA